MAQLFTIIYGDFKKEIEAGFDISDEISSQDVFDAFVCTLGKDTNVLSEEDLKGLVFRQFQSYGDFDKTMQKVAKSVSSIQKSTEDAIKAIDNNDSGALKNAYAQLKDYQKRIDELEEGIYTDDITGVSNRKHLMNYELDEEEQFKTDGALLYLSINNFAQINKEHGHEAGDAVLKFVSKILDKHLKNIGVVLIRYMGAQFMALAKIPVSVKAKKICQETVDHVLSKKFKTHSGEVLNIELEFEEIIFSKGQKFKGVYERL